MVPSKYDTHKALSYSAPMGARVKHTVNLTIDIQCILIEFVGSCKYRLNTTVMNIKAVLYRFLVNLKNTSDDKKLQSPTEYKFLF